MQRRVFLLGGVMLGAGRVQAQRPAGGGLEVGKEVPALTLGGLADTKPVNLAELKGKPTLLFFGSCT